MPTEPIRWLHLSDFHIGMDDYESRKIFNHIHAHVREQCENGCLPDIIFITGDIANRGEQDEYFEFIENFLDPLRQILNEFSWVGNIFLVPGNHDLQRTFVKDVSRDSRLDSKSIFFRASIEGKENRAIHELRAFEKFGELLTLSDLYSENWLGFENGSFAEVLKIKGYEVGVAGVNTAWLSRDEYDKEKLTPGIDLLNSALKKIQSCDLRLLIGHHPVDWFYPKHRIRLQNLFGDNRLIYLHGHLHESRVLPTETGGGNFLQIQSGAAFQVFEIDETRWQNGLLWAEISTDLKKIHLQPRYWKNDEGRWGFNDDLHEDRRINGNWWGYPIPYFTGSEKEVEILDNNKPQTALTLPKGWSLVDENFLNDRSKQDLKIETFIQFFDGSIPTWHRDFLHALPKRNAVEQSIEIITQKNDIEKPSMLLISGAGGEGKSTAILQISLTLHETGNWNILWHSLEEAPLLTDLLQGLPIDKPWLIVSDDAHLLINDLKVLLPWLTQNRQDIHFLLASRVNDWYAEGGTTVGWSKNSQYHEIQIGKLEYNEAKSIIELWSQYGEIGLKSLYGSSINEAANKLVDASKDDKGGGDGAFLGAMLKIRMADGLKDHIKILLSRLGSRKIKKTKDISLLDAFAAIAFMHAEGFDFLSQPVLSQYIFNDPTKSVSGSILTPLGKEAAATSTGKFIFTRHSTIAKVAAEIFQNDFGIDAEDIFTELGVAAIEAWKNGAFVPELGKWRFDFPKHFSNQDRHNISIQIVKKQLGQNPENLQSITMLAKLYRDADLPDKATSVFREFAKGEKDRAYYYEWGASEGISGNQALSVLLDFASIADWHFHIPPNNTQAMYSLAGLSMAFLHLFDEFHNSMFRDARAACCILGLTLFLNSRTEDNFNRGLKEANEQGAPSMSIEEAFNVMERGVRETRKYISLDSTLTELLPNHNDIAFENLKKLIKRSIQRKSH